MRRKSLGGRYLAFLAIVYFGAEVGGVSLAASTPPICEEVCSESTACEESVSYTHLTLPTSDLV